MTWTPASPGGVAGEPVGEASGVEVGGFDDAETGAWVTALLAAVDRLAAGELWRCSREDLGRLVQVSEVASRRLGMVQARAAVDAHGRGALAGAGFSTAGAGPDATARSIAGWLRSLVNISAFQAKLRARAAVALFADPALSPELAQTRAAAQCGQIDPRHAVVIADTLEKLSAPLTPDSVVDADTRGDVEHVLVQHAAALDPAQTRVIANRAIALLDPDAGDRLAKDEQVRDGLRGLTLSRQSCGLVHLTGTLTPQCAGLLTTAIDAASAPRPATDGTRDTRTPAMRRHDGLQHVLAQVVAADALLPSTHGSPYRLVVTVPHATLTAELNRRTGTTGRATGTGPTGPTGSTHTGDTPGSGRQGEAFRRPDPDMDVHPVQPGLLPDGWPISPLTVQTMACSAELVPVLVDDRHQPLDVGDTQYPFPAKIRTAIITRDHGCTYPGCGAPAPWCDIHHLTRFRDRGPTSVTNGALLCGRHHRYVHALDLRGHVTTTGGSSHVHWDHRATSWTATTATTTARPPTRGSGPTDQQGNSPPPLTDTCLDQLLRRWQRRRQAHSHAA